MISIRLKILIIIVSSLLTLGAVFLFYAVSVTYSFRSHHLEHVASELMYESESVNRTIDLLQQNAVDLAWAGREYYLGRREHTDADGARLTLDNFRTIPDAVGGGIWYERFAFRPDRERFCFYACRDGSGKLALQEGFDSEKYDYPTQLWYEQIRRNAGTSPRASWSEVYVDELGTHTLMATVGAGIFDDDGKFVGMSTVDWEIESVVNKLCSLRPTPGSEVVLIDQEHSSVVADTADAGKDGKLLYKSKRVEDMPWLKDLGEIVPGRITVSRLKQDGKEYVFFCRRLDNEMSLVVKAPEKEFGATLKRRTLYVLGGAALLVALVLCGALYLITMRVNRPLKKLMAGVNIIGGGNLDVKLEVRGRDEIARLSATFNDMTSKLKEHIEKLGREMASKAMIDNELKTASSIQRDLLPCEFPPFPDRKEFDLRPLICPAKVVGGDFYDYFMPDGDHLVFLIADVSGKGVPAALFMAQTRTLIRCFAEAGLPPGEVFRRANERLCVNNETGMFVTAWMAMLDVRNGRMLCINAGHNRPLVKSRGGKFEYMKMPSGFVLGGFQGMTFPEFTIQLSPGSRVFLYTDGITEAENGAGEFFGERRLADLLNEAEAQNISLDEYPAFVRNRLREFSGNAEQSDDITMLIVEYFGPDGAPADRA